MDGLIVDKTKLTERCIEINVVDNQDKLKEISDKMLDILHENSDVVYVTANQLGYDCRVIGIKFSDGIKFFVNPMIIKQEGLHISIETSPVAEGTYLVPRNDLIEIGFQDLFGLAASATFNDDMGDIIQQAIQLLDALSIDDEGFGLKVEDDFLNASEEEKQEVIDMYLESLKDKCKEINEDIENNPELKQISDATKFLIAGAKGEIELEQQPKLSNRKRRKFEKFAKALARVGKNYTKKKPKRK